MKTVRGSTYVRVMSFNSIAPPVITGLCPGAGEPLKTVNDLLNRVIGEDLSLGQTIKLTAELVDLAGTAEPQPVKSRGVMTSSKVWLAIWAFAMGLVSGIFWGRLL
jgi:hypothetical protein